MDHKEELLSYLWPAYPRATPMLYSWVTQGFQPNLYGLLKDYPRHVHGIRMGCPCDAHEIFMICQ